MHQVERLQGEVAALKPLQAEVIELRERLGLNSRQGIISISSPALHLKSVSLRYRGAGEIVIWISGRNFDFC
jgi:hypothetical protein